jgi:hypothetical protein
MRERHARHTALVEAPRGGDPEALEELRREHDVVVCAVVKAVGPTMTIAAMGHAGLAEVAATVCGTLARVVAPLG